MNRKYSVTLSDQQREHLEKLISSGTAPVRMITHARILLKSDNGTGAPNWSYADICTAFDVSEMTVAHVRRTFAEQGFDAALSRKKPDRIYEHRLDGEAEAHLIALVCAEPPKGRGHWALRLLAEKMVKLDYVETVSHETVRQVLKKTNSSRG
jgi:Homeodomain-like domain